MIVEVYCEFFRFQWDEGLSTRIARSADGVDELVPRPKRKEWSEKSMELALRDVTNGVMGVRRAALEYNVPKSTLSDRVTGRVRPGARSGASRYLEEEEEEEIVQWIRGCAEVGCAKSIREVQAVVSTIVAKKLGITSVSISHGWWDKFRRPHPEFVMRSGKILHTNMLLR